MLLQLLQISALQTISPQCILHQRVSLPNDHAKLLQFRLYRQNTELCASGDSGMQDRLQINPIRFLGFNLLALMLAFGANFVGITSYVMSNTDPVYFRSTQLDQLYPIDGYRRYVDRDDHYEFIFPTDWVIDPRVLLYNTRSQEMPDALRAKRGLAPDSAFGPPGGDFTENISVVKNKVMDGFTLSGTLGSPQVAAQKILDTIIAAPGSGKTATLLRAEENIRNGQPVYEFEYSLQKPDQNFFRRTVSVVTNRGNELYTFTATSQESNWEKDKSKLLTTAASFQLSSY